MEGQKKFSPITIGLHWIVGLTMITLFFIGVYMAENEVYSLYPWHKSFGVLIVPFVLARVIWRIKSGWPTPVGQYSKIEQILAKLTHWVLISASVLMPVTGFMFSGASGHGVAVFGWTIAPENPDPNKLGEVIPFNPLVANVGHEMHEILGWIFIAAVALHVVGALKHHVMDKDGTLQRMLGKQID
ncbi:MAG: cytochrome b [Undibacterium sp.]|nr:cytochrome b [Undibacterium sp.]